MLEENAVGIDLRHPFTWRDALEAGVSASALRGPRFRRIFTGVYVHSSVQVTPLLRVRAALLIHPAGAFASHTSAALVHGLPVPHAALTHVSVLAERDRRRRHGIRNHVASEGTPVVIRNGIRVSSGLQTFVELGEVHELVDLVVAGDALVRRRVFSVDELRAYCASSAHRGAPAARRAAAYVRAEVDSPMETRLRMLIVLAGLPEPKVNHRVYDADGRLLYRFDLSYPDLKIVVEYDGRQHRDDLAQWDHDTVRKDWFDANGWRHVPVFSRGIYRDPASTLHRVEAALRSRGASVPRQRREEWRRFFPGQPA